MNAVDDLLSDSHLLNTNFFRSENHPTEGVLHALKTPTRWSESQPESVSPAPTLGEHTKVVLEELSYTDDEIQKLLESGVVSAGVKSVES